MSLDIPDQVRKTVIAGGNESWLDELPGVVGSLAREWSLMIGSSLAGGVYACSIGFQPFGDLLLAQADRLTA